MDNLLLMLAPLFSSKLLLVLFFGTLFGLILGVLPGLGPTTGGALILPFTMTLDPLSAIVLLTSIYCAGTYGGAITAVLINTPINSVYFICITIYFILLQSLFCICKFLFIIFYFVSSFSSHAFLLLPACMQILISFDAFCCH